MKDAALVRNLKDAHGFSKGLGFWGFRVWGLGLKVKGLGLKV